jgi:hypothetical protein
MATTSTRHIIWTLIDEWGYTAEELRGCPRNVLEDMLDDAEATAYENGWR